MMESRDTPEADKLAPSATPSGLTWRDRLGQIAPRRSSLKQDALGGLAGAIGSVPDGMAAAVLAGVSPIYGLYASMVGPIAGGLVASTALMVVTTTSAASIAAGESLAGLDGDERAQGLFLLTFLIGMVQVAAGLLRLGNLTRFVSHSVMVGFLSGIAVSIILGQLETFTGYDSRFPNKVMQALDLSSHIAQIEPRTVTIGLLALLLAMVLPKTRLGTIGTLVALLIPSVLVLLLHWDSVATVAASGAIPRGLPLPTLPHFSLLSVDIVTGAVAIGAIILIQGAGVSQSVPNRDGSPSNPSRDFTAQGVANAAAGLFMGQPVGGSVGQTALGVSAGAVTRWAAIFSGLWMAAILVLIPVLVGYVAMPALAALLILAGYNTIRFTEVMSIWRTGALSRITILTTFVATLFLPIQMAVGLGAALSAMMYLSRLSTDVALVEVVTLPDGRSEEHPAPKTLPSDTITTLYVYGSLFYAGAWTIGRILPSARGATRPVVILTLRGHPALGATFIDVLANYAEQIRGAGGRLYIAGVEAHVSEQLTRTGKLALSETVQIEPVSSIVGASRSRAYEQGTAWLVEHRPAAASP
jgi:SulP family sulfate permease